MRSIRLVLVAPAAPSEPAAFARPSDWSGAFRAWIRARVTLSPLIRCAPYSALIRVQGTPQTFSV